MKTEKAICLTDIEFKDGEKIQTLTRGSEYIIHQQRDGKLTVFTSPYWVHDVEPELFAGFQPFTGESSHSNNEEQR